ncbi:MAG: hypothetical protein H6766_04795 [Candidatus Peribacteria bacterium]|nr:MAG: hypothetical protein H6766_04795 [Candidatus Peribacteria bacterium]
MPRADLDESIISNLKQRNILLSFIPITTQSDNENIIKKSNINDSEYIIIDTSAPLSLQQIFSQIEMPFAS